MDMSSHPSAFFGNVTSSHLKPSDFVQNRFVFVEETRRTLTRNTWSIVLHAFDLITEKQYSFDLHTIDFTQGRTYPCKIINRELVLSCITRPTGLLLQLHRLNYDRKATEPSNVETCPTNGNDHCTIIVDRDQLKVFVDVSEGVVVFDIDEQQQKLERVGQFRISRKRDTCFLHWFDGKIWYQTWNGGNQLENSIDGFDVNDESVDSVVVEKPQELKSGNWKRSTMVKLTAKNEFCYLEYSYNNSCTEGGCHTDHAHRFAVSAVNLRTKESRVWQLENRLPHNLSPWLYSRNVDNQLVYKERTDRAEGKRNYTFFRIPTHAPDPLSLLAFVKARPQLNNQAKEMFANRISI